MFNINSRFGLEVTFTDPLRSNSPGAAVGIFGFFGVKPVFVFVFKVVGGLVGLAGLASR